MTERPNSWNEKQIAEISCIKLAALYAAVLHESMQES